MSRFDLQNSGGSLISPLLCWLCDHMDMVQHFDAHYSATNSCIEIEISKSEKAVCAQAYVFSIELIRYHIWFRRFLNADRKRIGQRYLSPLFMKRLIFVTQNQPPYQLGVHGTFHNHDSHKRFSFRACCASFWN